MGQARPYGDRSILIVEDDYLIRLDLVDVFRDVGFRVVEADSAEDALEILSRDPGIRVVLSDVELRGDMDGIRLVHFIRERYPPTTLFVMSSRADVPTGDLPGGAVFVRKPFNAQHLIRQVDAAAPD